jgi:hypothetical protein
MNSEEIRSYVGFGSPRTFEEVKSALSALNCDHLQEVILDLSPRSGKEKPVLADSRDVTQYGLVLQNERAHKILRRYNDLDIARQVILTESLPSQAQDIKRRIDALREEVENSVESTSPELAAAVDELVRSARLLSGAVNALVER